jgi:hypothetical protein
MVHTFLRTTRPYLSHTCPTRHLKVQNYEDTCDVACSTQKDNEFERQPRLPVQHRSSVTNLNYNWTIIFHFMFAGHSERVFRLSVTKVTEFLSPNITQSSDDHRRDTLSIDLR